MKKPYIGAIVDYVVAGQYYPDGCIEPFHLPATVRWVHKTDPAMVCLAVLGIHAPAEHNIRYSEDARFCTWHWPEEDEM